MTNPRASELDQTSDNFMERALHIGCLQPGSPIEPAISTGRLRQMASLGKRRKEAPSYDRICRSVDRIMLKKHTTFGPHVAGYQSKR